MYMCYKRYIQRKTIWGAIIVMSCISTALLIYFIVDWVKASSEIQKTELQTIFSIIGFALAVFVALAPPFIYLMYTRQKDRLALRMVREVSVEEATLINITTPEDNTPPVHSDEQKTMLECCRQCAKSRCAKMDTFRNGLDGDMDIDYFRVQFKNVEYNNSADPNKPDLFLDLGEQFYYEAFIDKMTEQRETAINLLLEVDILVVLSFCRRTPELEKRTYCAESPRSGATERYRRLRCYF